MDSNQANRLGVDNKKEIMNHPFFHNVDFKILLEKRYRPPNLDLQPLNFEKMAAYDLKDEDYEETNKRVNRVRNFTFIADDEEEKMNKEKSEL